MSGSIGTSEFNDALLGSAVSSGKVCKKSRFSFWLIFIILFLIHCFANIVMAKKNQSFFLQNDGEEYLTGAVSFAETGRIMTGPARYYEAPRSHDIPEIYRPPLQALLTGILVRVVGDPMVAAALIQAAAAAFLAWVVWRIAFLISGSVAAGWFAVLLITFHPLLLTFSLRYSSEIPFILFLALFVLSWLERKDKDAGIRNFIAMGITGGLACGVRPTALLLLPAFAVWMLIRYAAKPFFPCAQQPTFRSALKGYLVYATAFILALSPLILHNYIGNGVWNPAGCFGGFNYFLGNNKDNAAAYRAQTGAEFLTHQNRGWYRAIDFAQAMPKDLPPAEQDRRFRQETHKEIREMGYPEFCRMTALKAWHFIRPWPLAGAHPVSVFLIICISELLLFSAGFGGVILLRKNRELLLLLLMIFFVGWTAHTIVHLQMRHRVPFMDFPLILTASVFLGWIWSFLFKKQEKEPVPSSENKK